MAEYRNFINGKFVHLIQRHIDNVNPANLSDVVGTMRMSTRAEAKAPWMRRRMR